MWVDIPDRYCPPSPVPLRAAPYTRESFPFLSREDRTFPGDDRQEDFKRFIVYPIFMYQIKRGILFICENVNTMSAGCEELGNRETPDESDHAVFTLDLEGNFTYVSPHCQDIFGYLPEDLMGKNMLSVVAPGDRGVTLERFREVLSGKSFPSNCRILDANGHTHWIRTISLPLQCAGTVNGIVGIVADISRGKRKNKAFLENESKFRSITEQFSGGMFLLDERGAVVEWNPAIAKITGISCEKAREQLIHDLLPQLFPHGRNRKQEQGLPEEERGEPDSFIGAKFPFTVPLEFDMEDPGAISRHLEAQFFALPDAGRKLICGTIRDVSRRKQAELALLDANKKLNLLVSITRHDIRNQLTALLGYIDIAKTLHDDRKIHGYLEKQEAIVHAIVSQLEFSRDYQEIGAHSPEWQDLGEIIAKVRRAFPMDGIGFENRCRGVMIFADPLLYKVIGNLIDNALRHANDLKSIRFFTREDEQERLHIICENDGGGIPQADKEKIFEPGHGKNTGLGLFLAREILAITGIAIEETGDPPMEARFDITVPQGSFFRFIPREGHAVT